VPSCLIEKEHSVRARRHFGGDFSQMQVHCLDVASGKDEGAPLPSLGQIAPKMYVDAVR
jgi:hypothetical protein